ncbi:f2c02ab0-0ee4-4af9-83f5-49d52d36b498 [Thermothielavioides terrestris]|uniref:F2c02ab0-0ee4-4af9-83f5-49d52d36b498 n=1 Tax=Thermothielavioides terrestris TaxID=2587410 RepID=A0A3S4EZI8_9PEZI|nr:f2c02ab0-0ee4-4af9-83f5-49d52d36b498 [Thermothielavioides terrestris]
MSARALLTSTTGRALRPAAITAPARRTLSQTRFFGLKESSPQDQDAEDVEFHKQDSLAKQKKGQGHWKPELASVSEESVKADRLGGPQDSSAEAMRRLQEQTKGRAEETSKNRTSMGDGL